MKYKLMTGKQVLQDARKLLTDPDHWTQGVDARTNEGISCSIFSKNARCFCLSGALYKAALRDDGMITFDPALEHAMNRVRAAISIKGFGANIPFFNDYNGRTHAEVIEVLDKAIELPS